MKKKKKYANPDKPKIASEPITAYTPPNANKGKLIFFNSFEESEEYGRKLMADATHEQCLENLEIMRKRIFAKHLLPDGTWPPLSKTITIIKGSYL